MDDLNYGSAQIKFWQVHGEVLDTDRYSETHVQARGGGYAYPSSVNVSQTNHQDFWIRDDDGRERAIQLEDTSIPLRPGQRITLINAQRQGCERSWMCSLVNHATDQVHEITSPKVLQHRFRMVRITGISLILALIVAALVVYLTMPPSGYYEQPWRMAEWGWAITAGIAVLIWGGWRKSRRKNQVTKTLKARIDVAIERAQQHT